MNAYLPKDTINACNRFWFCSVPLAALDVDVVQSPPSPPLIAERRIKMLQIPHANIIISLSPDADNIYALPSV